MTSSVRFSYLRYLLCLSLFAIALTGQTARAGYVNTYSGNSSFGSTTNTVGLYVGFAVLDRLSGGSSPGDAYGTGNNLFDLTALAGSGSAAFDTSARYLYLYQMICSPTSAAAFSGGEFWDGQPRYAALTSYAQWNLFLSDDGGKFTVANAFGVDGVPFVNMAPANLGVVSPSVIAAGSPIQKNVVLSRTDTKFDIAFPTLLSPGQTTQLLGFTTNSPPEIVGFAHEPGPFVALGHIAVPVPEPSTSALGFIGCLCLVACLVRRRLARLPRFGFRQSMSHRAAGLVALCLCAIAGTATSAQAGFSFAHHGSFDPVSEGFTGGTVFGAPSTVGPIANDLGSPAWSIVGMAQSSQYGYSSGPLTLSQLTDVGTHGFTLTIEARAVQAINPTYDATHPVGIAGGSLYTGVQRFDIYLGLDASGDTVVFLPTAVDAVGPGSSLVGAGPSYTLTGQGSSYHTYSLVYDPGTQLADLFVDGVSRIQGYGGNTTFNTTNAGLVFGGASGGQANFRLAAVQSVPEPTSAALLAAGGAALVALMYRRRRDVRNR